MAEVAAGIVGIAGFGIQLAESVVKLKRFCSEVKGARRKLEGLTQDLRILVDLIDLISRRHAGSPELCAALEPSLSSCNSATRELAILIDGLLEKARRKKLMGSVKAVMLDQRIRDLSDKVEQTKSLLTIATSICIPEQIIGQLATLIDAQQKANSLAVQTMAGPTLRKPSDLSFECSPSSMNQMGVDTRNRNELAKMGKTGGRRYKFHMSPWLLQCAWTLTAQRAYSGWMFSLHCHGRLPGDHPAAIACFEGDCPKMQSLLDAGQVSPHDEVGGRSLVQLAANGGHLSMIKLLCELGADMRLSSRDSAECSLVNEFWYGWRSNRELSGSIPKLSIALRFFENDCELDIDDDDTMDEGLFLLYTRPFASLSVHDRLVMFDCMLHGCSELGPCLSIIEPALVDPTYFTTEIEIRYRPTLLHLLAHAFGKDFCTDEATYTERLGALLQAGVAVSNLHELDQLGSGMTPLMHVIFSANRYYQHFEANYNELRWELKPFEKRLQHVRRALQRWLLLMKNSGVNLHKYGKIEGRSFQKHWKHNQSVLWEYCYSFVEILGIKHGFEPSEWDLWAIQPSDAHVEEFWRMIEDPVPTLPGGWVEDCPADPDPNVARVWRKPLGQRKLARDIKAGSIK